MKLTDTRFLISLGLLLVVWATYYSDALIAMEAVWRRSDTFAHGYLIAPIVLWLFWRDKKQLVELPVKPTLIPLLFLAVSLLASLFSYAADINVLAQLSAVASFICIVWLMIGHKVAWRYSFPLGYLFFLVPMGENLIPWLQDVTAWISVFLLQVHGIPTFRDGLYIQLPTGLFEVAVACSGIRYLIASAAVGALYAYLTYYHLYKKVLFFVFALLLPILANGIRAYLIMIIAHYSDMKYATGADHLVYGWVFFGFVIMVMFWIGGKFADVIPNDEHSNSVFSRSNHFPIWVFPAIGIALMVGSTTLYRSIPVTEVDTTTSESNSSNWGISFFDGVSRVQQSSGDLFEVFKATYANKQTSGELVSWRNIFHDPDVWTVVESSEVSINNQKGKFVHLRDISGRPRSYIYQYQVGSQTLTSPVKVKLLQAIQTLTRQSDTSYVRALSIVGVPEPAQAKQLLIERFASLDSSENSNDSR